MTRLFVPIARLSETENAGRHISSADLRMPGTQFWGYPVATT